MPDRALPVLDVRGLNTVFKIRGGEVHAVNNVSFDLKPGELLGVVGESGSGKSVTMMSLLGLVYTVGMQIMEPLRKQMGLNKVDATARAKELLELVGIPDAEQRLKDYPHQFSGGMRQRVMIAIALACDPKVLIADEPTTALDVTIQAQILELMKDLQERLGMAVIWITHDLGVVAGIADRVLVMYGGQIVEQAPTRELFKNPQHPYTRALLKTVPRVTGERDARLAVIDGQPPILGAAPTACPFRDRCDVAFALCARQNPPRFDVGSGHDAACFYDANTSAPRLGVPEVKEVVDV